MQRTTRDTVHAELVPAELVAAVQAALDDRREVLADPRNPDWYPEFQTVERGSGEHVQSLPMGRQGTVQDIANACLFYASDESAYITGDRMNVVGGRYIV